MCHCQFADNSSSRALLRAQGAIVPNREGLRASSWSYQYLVDAEGTPAAERWETQELVKRPTKRTMTMTMMRRRRWHWMRATSRCSRRTDWGRTPLLSRTLKMRSMRPRYAVCSPVAKLLNVALLTVHTVCGAARIMGLVVLEL